MDKIASGFIRNSASIGGNLVMAQRNYFPSDIATLLLALSSSVSILTGRKFEKITLEQFFSTPPLDSKSVLLSVHIPYWEPIESSGTNEYNHRLLFETYRVVPLPICNALPYLNATFSTKISSHKDGVLVNSIQLVFGAYGVKHSTSARKVEEHLTGKILSLDILAESNQIKLQKARMIVISIKFKADIAVLRKTGCGIK
ncbi:indole-3-acetaldehyde oxidase-like [Olea europaea subsp. europaea]|uniref:Indole-3-acetaldehyde oxidase-like n=1 Tax=Olea europaea subsp. europaea TaxID=158383 RepID=A0A8S0VIY4_OLEEU|nr:indole-3-acetaldehyde oxidase-like [Olea europaea subsp. europaea]